MTVADLISSARNGSQRAVGRLLSLVESDRRDEVLANIDSSPVRVIGITGPPGAGKSTTIAVLVAAYRERGCRVAVLAVDPSSPFCAARRARRRVRRASPPALARRRITSHHTYLCEKRGGSEQSEIEIAAVAD